MFYKGGCCSRSDDGSFGLGFVGVRIVVGLFFACTVHCDYDLKEEIGDSSRGLRGIVSRIQFSLIAFISLVESNEAKRKER